MGFPAGSGPAVARMGGRGVTPTPPLFFFLSGGYPPPPQVPGRAIRQNPRKTADLTLHAGDSTRNTGSGHSKKVPVSHMGGRGVAPPPPSLLFFKWGVPSPHVPGQQGGTPLPSFWKILVMAGTSGFLEDSTFQAGDVDSQGRIALLKKCRRGSAVHFLIDNVREWLDPWERGTKIQT